ncbi:MAG: hypothetical protein NT015_02875 [Alphaproteobacteria bacterium]|nr:hypothetical protein [Alphaproteobacteria bacterium]
MITTIGNTREPENATRERNANAAIETVMRQIMAHGLNNLAKNPVFPGATATAVVAETPPAEGATETPASDVPAEATPTEVTPETPAEAQTAPAN